MQTLLSVMEQGDPICYIEKLNIRTDTVIVNQYGEEESETELTLKSPRCADMSAADQGSLTADGTGGGTSGHGTEINVRIIGSAERGLSKSRNRAMAAASDDICILCDNDVRYEDSAPEQILAAFERYPDAGIICFFIERPERHEPVRRSEGVMSKKDMMRIFSPEMAVRRSKLKGLRFDEDFGAGARYSMGEENIFLFEAKRRGIKCIYVPVKIAETLPNESSWFRGYDTKFFYDRGAGYEAMDKALWYPLAWQFLIRKRSLYLDTVSMADAYKAMKKGREIYRKERALYASDTE